MMDPTEDECETLSSSGWTVKVSVIAEPGPPPDGVVFRLDSNLKGAKGELVFDKTKDRMPKRDHYIVEFDLDDKTTLGLQFAPNPSRALWVATGSQTNPPPCPMAASYSDEFYAVCVDPSGKRLTVRNDDDTIALFSFSLGFLRAGADPKDPQNYVRYDPIGDNQDGGIK